MGSKRQQQATHKAIAVGDKMPNPKKTRTLRKAVALAKRLGLKDATTARMAKEDTRTLFIWLSEKKQETVDELKKLHPDIQFVSKPRSAGQNNSGIEYAFIVFGNAEECNAAKNKLANMMFKGKMVDVDLKKKPSDKKDLVIPTSLSVLFAKRSQLIKEELKMKKGEKRKAEVDKEEFKEVGNDSDEKEETNKMETPAMTRTEKRKAKKQEKRPKKNTDQKTKNEVGQTKDDINNNSGVTMENWDTISHTNDELVIDEGKAFGDSVAVELDVADHDEVTRNYVESDDKKVDERNVSEKINIKSEELGSQFMEGEGLKVLAGLDNNKKEEAMIKDFEKEEKVVNADEECEIACEMSKNMVKPEGVTESNNVVAMDTVKQEDVMTRSEVALNSVDQIGSEAAMLSAKLGERNTAEEETSTRGDLESIVEEIQEKVEEQQRKMAEERLKIIDEQMKMENERLKIKKREEKSKKKEQKIILGRDNCRPKIVFSFNSL